MHFDKDKVKEFCDTNKRYIAAGIVGLVLLVLLVFCVGKNAKKSTPGDGTEGTEQTGTAAPFELDPEFEKDSNDDLKTLITDYLNAYASDDLDTLTKLADPISDNEKSYIGVFSQYIEGYQNISCYSKSGLTNGSYLVSVTYDLKFVGVETLAPGLEFYYVETGKDGKLYINNLYSSYNLGRGENELDPSIYAIVLKYEQQDDVTELQRQVEEAYNAAIAKDANLAAMLTSTIPNAMTEWVNSIAKEPESSEQDAQQTTEQDTQQADQGTQDDAAQDNAAQNDAGQADQPTDQTPETPQATAVMAMDNGINVRNAPDASADAIGAANQGEVYTKLAVEGDWVKIDYKGTEGYIKAEFVQDVTN